MMESEYIYLGFLPPPSLEQGRIDRGNWSRKDETFCTNSMRGPNTTKKN